MGTAQRGRTVSGAIADRDKPGAEVATTKNQAVREFVSQMEKALVEQLPAQIPPAYFIRACVTLLRGNESLAKIAMTPRGRASIYVALLEAARFGLMPGTEEGAVVPFKGTATWIPQAQGLVKMMHNTGKIAGVHNRFIHQHDAWEVSYGTNSTFMHKPYLKHEDGTPTTREERGPAIYAYCYLDLTDGSQTPVTLISREDAEWTRDNRSRGYRYAEDNKTYNSTWHTEFDAMWLKTAVRGHSKYAPKTPVLVELLATAARDDVQQPDAAKTPKPQDFGAPDLDGEVLSDSADDDLATARNGLMGLFNELGVTNDLDRRGIVAMLGREMPDDDPLPPGVELTGEQIARCIEKLTAIRAGEPDAAELTKGLMALAKAGRRETRAGRQPAAKGGS